MPDSIMSNAARSNRVSAVSPFFTVLIPTMNRPELLVAAVESVLRQTFKDFELIVSANSTTEEATRQNREIIEKHAEDPRVRYIRPETWMNMPDHWEFASRHASGRYVLILTDRFVMRPSAFEFLRLKIAQLQDDGAVISWHSDSAFNASGIVNTAPFTGATEIVESKQMISEYANIADWKSSQLWVNRLPRMLNCCYRDDVAQKIREKHGRLFYPLSPDYTGAYLLLAYTDRVAYLDTPLYMNHGNKSNGRHSLVFGLDEYLSSLGDEDVFYGTPVPLSTVTNLLVRDLMMVKNLVGESFPDIKLSLVGYFMCNYRELLYMERLGTQRDVRALYAQWWEGVRMLPSEQQEQIKEYVDISEKQRVSFAALRRLSVRLNLDSLYHLAIGKMRYLRHRFNGKAVYANVLEAAMMTDDLISKK